VPKGLKRFYGNDDLHFITASCYHRERCSEARAIAIYS
jgi:hypothetical protein